MAATTRRRAPFRLGTRQRRQYLGSLNYAANQTLSMELPRVGYLSRLIVGYRGTHTLSAAGALSDLGPWNIAQRFRVSTNLGMATLVDVSGYGAYLAQRLQQAGQDFSKAGIGATTPHADLHAAPVAMGANTWCLSWVLPIGANPGREFEFGLINLQSPETRVTLEVVTGNITDAASNVTGITGTFDVWVEYYEVPDPRAFEQPPLTVVRLLEEQMPIGQTGENVYTFPRAGVLMQTINVLRLNGARSDSFDSALIRFNKTDTIYRNDRRMTRILERAATGLDPITGVFSMDFWQADAVLGTGDGRDHIDLEEMSTVEQITVVTAGATLGANNNFLSVVRRIAQRLTQS